MNLKKKLLFSGELPPSSAHGVSYSNAHILKIISNKYNIIIDQEIIKYKNHGKFSLNKILNLFRRIINILHFSFKYEFDTFYLCYSNSFYGSLKSYILMSLFKIFNRNSRVVMHIHRGDLEYQLEGNILKNKIFVKILKLTDKIIVLSETTKKFILKKYYYKKDIYILDNTVYNEVFLKKRFNSKKKFNCIFISNYIEEKGIIVLLEAFKLLDHKFHLKCYGNFTNPNLKKKIHEYTSQNISIYGPVYDVEKFKIIVESDLLILPSFNEGKPIILLESMMLGTPFIASNVGYIKEMNDDDYNLFLENINKESLFEKINYFAKLSIDQKKSISEKLQLRYIRLYSNNNIKRKILEIFND